MARLEHKTFLKTCCLVPHKQICTRSVYYSYSTYRNLHTLFFNTSSLPIIQRWHLDASIFSVYYTSEVKSECKRWTEKKKKKPKGWCVSEGNMREKSELLVVKWRRWSARQLAGHQRGFPLRQILRSGNVIAGDFRLLRLRRGELLVLDLRLRHVVVARVEVLLLERNRRVVRSFKDARSSTLAFFGGIRNKFNLH